MVKGYAIFKVTKPQKTAYSGVRFNSVTIP